MIVNKKNRDLMKFRMLIFILNLNLRKHLQTHGTIYKMNEHRI